jgi:N utilization substance protein B
MISRRNIRIKVFQTIFEAGMQEDAPDVKKLHSSLDHKFEQSHALFAACCHLNYLFAEYVLIYAQQKASKHLPTSADLSINTKLAGNLVLQKLKNNPSFNKIVKDHHIHLIFENEWIRQLFNQIIDTPTEKWKMKSKFSIISIGLFYSKMRTPANLWPKNISIGTAMLK